jgi:hypothetical protein
MPPSNRVVTYVDIGLNVPFGTLRGANGGYQTGKSPLYSETCLKSHLSSWLLEGRRSAAIESPLPSMPVP